MVSMLVAVDASLTFTATSAPNGWVTSVGGGDHWTFNVAKQIPDTQFTYTIYTNCDLTVDGVSMGGNNPINDQSGGTILDSGSISFINDDSSTTTFNPLPYSITPDTNGGVNVFIQKPSAGVTCEVSALTIGTINYLAVGGSADPHLALAYGGMADFRGIDNTFFSMLSAPKINMAMKTNDAVFMIKHNHRVEGSFMTEVAVNVMSGTEMVTVHTVADKVTGFRVENSEGKIISQNGQWSNWTGHGVVAEQLMLTTSIRAHGWEVNATRKPVYNHVTGPKWRFDFTLRPLVDDESKWACYPHGIIGQSFDGTGIGLVGKMDDYDDYDVKTSAMAEGVIEGTADDYIVKPTSPEFKYSRFDAKTPDECKPRDSKLLSGLNIRVPGNSVVGASD